VCIRSSRSVAFMRRIYGVRRFFAAFLLERLESAAGFLCRGNLEIKQSADKKPVCNPKR